MKPRVAFLGVGWIGRNRMEAICATGAVEPVAVCDPSDECAEAALALAPGAIRTNSLEALLDLAPDGLVIATPSAGHATETMTALRRGVAVFCQKPLGLTESEARSVVSAARSADRLLSVDFSYRQTAAVAAVAELVQSGSLGDIHTVDLAFHNAWGPDKAWFYDRTLSGGGCVMDLGVHLVDLALWLFGNPQVKVLAANLLAEGRQAGAGEVEDFATATLRLVNGPVVRLACSWRAHAGREAVIMAQFHGTAGGALVHNVGGSFHDFEAERFSGIIRERVVGPPDDWGGRTAAEWARQLARSPVFDPAAASIVSVAEVIEEIYAAGLGIRSATGPSQLESQVSRIQRG